MIPLKATATWRFIPTKIGLFVSVVSTANQDVVGEGRTGIIWRL